MKLGLAIRELHRSENSMAAFLLKMSDRHKVDHAIYHVARDLATWSQTHVHELTEVGERYGVSMRDKPKDDSGIMAGVRQKASEVLGERPEPGLLLLADLRRVHRKAAGLSVDWELLGQAAQAAKDKELLELTKRCHPQTLRQMRWANAMLKEISPQVLMS
ncbi:MAG TPA: hypothetical protein VHG70_03160 [Nocardioidaceae bacterium]|nr:hypothetical protein [Nocardioidaceae bacterium]